MCSGSGNAIKTFNGYTSQDRSLQQDRAGPAAGPQVHQVSYALKPRTLPFPHWAFILLAISIRHWLHVCDNSLAFDRFSFLPNSLLTLSTQPLVSP